MKNIVNKKILFSNKKAIKRKNRRYLSVERKEWNKVREFIFSDRKKERGGYLFGNTIKKNGKTIFQIKEFFPALKDDLIEQNVAMFFAKADFHARAMNRFKEAGYDMVLELHSHPFSDKARFSSVDNGSFPESVHIWKNIMKADDLLRIVLGFDMDGFTCDHWNEKDKKKEEVFGMVLS